ncbi:hypothetical protein NDK50_26825 [Paraburkholderia bryophila]|uniref:hypothetical protein n=1 Tax=Paraburkholderia bryophila TaxID=420952 RepID=UPI00234B2D50|nr:hypothetical protein [Paraburkholderia bryophila]WCM24429.1 hypothetical protein NDK50_26825 [Paraburkholderia bryophila]
MIEADDVEALAVTRLAQPLAAAEVASQGARTSRADVAIWRNFIFLFSRILYYRALSPVLAVFQAIHHNIVKKPAGIGVCRAKALKLQRIVIRI